MRGLSVCLLLALSRATLGFVARSPPPLRAYSTIAHGSTLRQTPTLRVDTEFSSKVALPKHRTNLPQIRPRPSTIPVAVSSLLFGCALANAASPAFAAATGGSASDHVLTALTVAGGGVGGGGSFAADFGTQALGLLDRTVGPGFVQAFSLIFVSELGDKTFFIAALLSAKFSKAVSFTGSVAALAVMTGISVGLGQLFHAVPSGFTNGLPIDDYIACAAFAYFGYRTLSEAYAMDDGDKGGELEDAEEALKELADDDEATSGGSGGALARLRSSDAFDQLVQTFALVFAAEFGDRSFLSTIALSAAQNPASVFTGAVAAHIVATAGAVAGGALLSEYISEKVVGYIGGALFIVFAFTTALGFF